MKLKKKRKKLIEPENLKVNIIILMMKFNS